MKNFLNSKPNLVERLKKSKNILLGLGLSVATFSSNVSFGQGCTNLVTNGNFAAVAAGTQCLPTGSFSANQCGTGSRGYFISTNVGVWGYPQANDATPGGGTNYMAIAAIEGNNVGWAQQVSVVAGSQYNFSIRARNLAATSGSGNAQITLNVSTSAALTVGTAITSIVNLPGNANDPNAWNTIAGTWTAPTTGSVWLQVVSNNAVFAGHEFAIDDISFIAPVASPVVANATVCSGGQVPLFPNPVQSGVVYDWYTVSTGGAPVFTGNTYTTPVLTANTSYWVAARSGTCSSQRTQVNVTVNPLPNPVLTVPTSACAGTAFSYSLSYGSGNKYTFTRPASWVTQNGGGGPGGFGETGTMTASGTFTLTSTTTAGCSKTVSANITINPSPTAPTVVVPAAKICKGEVEQLTPSVTGGVWSILSSTTTSATPSTISNTGLFTAIGAGLYTVNYKITNASGCSASVNTSITVGALPFSIVGPDKVCNYNTYKYTVSENAVGNLYTWRRDGNTSSTLATNTLLTSDLYSGSAAANSTITLKVQGDFACMDGTKKSEVAEKTITYAAIPSGVVIKCADATCNTLTATNSTGLTLRWYHYPNGLQELGSATTITNPKNSSYIACDVTNSSGCKTTVYWYPYSSYPCAIVYDYSKSSNSSQNYTANARLASTAKESAYNLLVHPNPANNIISFESDGSEGVATIFNTQGLVLNTIKLSSGQKAYSLDIADYTSGVYFMHLYSTNGNVYSTSIVKE